MPDMRVLVNGEVREVPEGTTVAALLDRMDLGGRRLAVERNQEIVPRSAHAQTVLHDQDRIEVVHAVGGG
ncbi:MAG: sulfur carrier protein ThiS [Acidithiobacillus sp.]|jgi:sulfur carrier protein|uniref:sulfur carrier protein ThiS n=1 Tax=Acidithiobacillus sp. TaxID=1872118 RepID=UPI003CFC920F